MLCRGLLDPEDEATMIPQNVGNCSLDMVLHRRRESFRQTLG